MKNFQVPSYKVQHDKVYSKDTTELIDAHNKISNSCLPKRPNVWNDEEWKKYLLDKQSTFTSRLEAELSGTPESENYLMAAECRDHLNEIKLALTKI